MDAKRCDRCKCYYESEYLPKDRYEINHVVDHYSYDSEFSYTKTTKVDLCKDCMNDLMNFMKNDNSQEDKHNGTSKQRKRHAFQ